MSINNPQSRIVGIAFVAFMGLGMAAGLLGLAWPSIQKQFNLSLDSVNILLLLSTMAYSLSGFWIGRLMTRFGSGTSLLAGSIILVVCLFGIAIAPTWTLIIVFAAISGVGNGIIDAGLNLYVATYHSPKQMSWLHAWFGIGITIGPLIMTFVFRQQLGWQVGYAIVGIALIVVILLFAFTRRLWRDDGIQTAENKPVRRARIAESLRSPALWLAMITFFAYVGLEFGMGQWAYTLLTEGRGLKADVAGLWVSIFWAVFTGGRFVYGAVANRFRTDQVLQLCMLAAIVGVALFWWHPTEALSLVGLVIAGIAQAPIFPLLMSDTARRVGPEHAENGISMQMGAVGISAAILPGLIGTFGKNFGLETMAGAFVVMAILVYGCQQLTGVIRSKQPVLAPAEERPHEIAPDSLI